jgi:hypothetical protein
VAEHARRILASVDDANRVIDELLAARTGRSTSTRIGSSRWSTSASLEWEPADPAARFVITLPRA